MDHLGFTMCTTMMCLICVILINSPNRVSVLRVYSYDVYMFWFVCLFQHVLICFVFVLHLCILAIIEVGMVYSDVDWLYKCILCKMVDAHVIHHGDCSRHVKCVYENDGLIWCNHFGLMWYQSCIVVRTYDGLTLVVYVPVCTLLCVCLPAQKVTTCVCSWYVLWLSIVGCWIMMCMTRQTHHMINIICRSSYKLPTYCINGATWLIALWGYWLFAMLCDESTRVIVNWCDTHWLQLEGHNTWHVFTQVSPVWP